MKTVFIWSKSCSDVLTAWKSSNEDNVPQKTCPPFLTSDPVQPDPTRLTSSTEAELNPTYHFHLFQLMKLLVLSFLSSIFQLRLAACCLCRASQGEKIDSLLLVGWICLLLYLDYKHINTMFSVVFCSVWAPGLLKLQELLSQTRFSSRSAAGIQPSERILFMRKSENVCTYPPRILRSINCNP